MYQLIIESGRRQGQRIQPSGRDLTVGRGAGNGLQLVEDGVSANHCVVRVTRGGIMIHDCQSANGVYVNNERVQQTRLSSGDEIEVGSVRLRFEFVHGGPGEHRRRGPLFWLSVLAVGLTFAVEFGALGLAVWTRVHRFTPAEVDAILKLLPPPPSADAPVAVPPVPAPPPPAP
jgi:hypothetical protein